MISEFKQYMTKFENMLTDLNEQVSRTEKDIEKIKNNISSMEEKIAHIFNAYLKYETLLKQINQKVSGINKQTVTAEINVLKSKIQQYNDTLIKLEANKKYDELTEHLYNDNIK
mgnify:FL=1